MGKTIEYLNDANEMRPEGDKYKPIIISETITIVNRETISFEQLEYQLAELMTRRLAIDAEITSVKNKIKELSAALTFDYVRELPAMKEEEIAPIESVKS